MAKKRGNYFELNLYTVNQLLILRRELAKLLANDSFDVRVLDLLFDVAGHNCDRDFIRAILQSINDGDSSSCIAFILQYRIILVNYKFRYEYTTG